jgi:hypothetical protein
MKDVIVFSHMMKTAGTSLSKQLIQYYGTKVHNVLGGFRIEDDYYNKELLREDFKKKKGKTKVLIGHPIRPYIDFNLPDYNLRWFTFVRDPQKRYLSHYFHKYNGTNFFKQARYNVMNNKNIIEWEKIDMCSNYQCKFISGEANAQKAIDIIENKFEWVAITEEYEDAVESFKAHFKLGDLYISNEVMNRSTANQN